MDAETYRRLEETFHQAAAVPPGPLREQLVADGCGGDKDLVARVCALLRSDDATGGSAGPPPDQADRAAMPLPRVGPFQAQSLLGRGGAGVVFRAVRVDEQFEQTVAIKILHAGGSHLAHRGFLDERRILARLDHPGIAKIFDGGVTPDGAPYLVMELVEGLPIDAYCRERQLEPRARLRLLREVCDAVSYAHRNLVVHLDLKPSNILMSAGGRVKLLDFGTAKLLASFDAGVTQQLATPRYASPEQLRGDHAGVPSDVYSLGVILAELLTGQWPFGDPDSRMTALRRSVEDVKPKWDAVANPRLRKWITGDVTTILDKALASDPDRRYRTVEEFSADLDRFLNGYPIQAHPPSALYRVRRYLMRNRLALAAAVAGLGLTAFAVVQTRQAASEATRREEERNALMGEVSRMIHSHLREAGSSKVTRDAAASMLANYLRLEPASPDWRWRFWASGLHGLIAEMSFDRYAPSLYEPTRAASEWQAAIAQLEQVPPAQFLELKFDHRNLDWALLAWQQKWADALVESGHGHQALRQFAVALSRHQQGAGSQLEVDVAAWWDMLADWLGASELSCPGEGPACGVPLPFKFALEQSAQHYESAYRSGPKMPLLGRHYADALLRLGRLAEAEQFLAQIPPNETSVIFDRLRADAAFSRQQYRQAVQHLDHALARIDLKETSAARRRASLRWLRGRAKHRAGIAGATDDTRNGLTELIRFASDPNATSDFLGRVAGYLLTAEPPGLRDRRRAAEFARRAVRITGGELSGHLVTLANATGDPGDVIAAARVAQEQAEDVRILTQLPRQGDAK